MLTERHWWQILLICCCFSKIFSELAFLDCSFENNNYCQWIGSNFSITEYGSSSDKTGPQNAQHGSFYAVFEVSQFGENETAVLESPNITLSQVCFSFYYHMYGRTMGTLTLSIRSDGGSKELWKVSGNQSNIWHSMNFSITELPPYRIQLTAYKGPNLYSIIALDNLSARSGDCSDDPSSLLSSSASSSTIPSPSKESPTTTREPPPLVVTQKPSDEPDEEKSFVLEYLPFLSIPVGAVLAIAIIIIICQVWRKRKQRGISHISNEIASRSGSNVYDDLERSHSKYNTYDQEEVYDAINESNMIEDCEYVDENTIQINPDYSIKLTRGSLKNMYSNNFENSDSLEEENFEKFRKRYKYNKLEEDRKSDEYSRIDEGNGLSNYSKPNECKEMFGIIKLKESNKQNDYIKMDQCNRKEDYLEPKESNKQNDYIKMDKCNGDEDYIEPSESNQQDNYIKMDKFNGDEDYIKPSESNQQDDDYIEPKESNKQNNYIKMDNFNGDEDYIEPNKSNQQDNYIKMDKCNEDEDYITPKESNPQNDYIKMDKCNEDEDYIKPEEANQQNDYINVDKCHTQEEYVKTDSQNFSACDNLEPIKRLTETACHGGCSTDDYLKPNSLQDK